MYDVTITYPDAGTTSPGTLYLHGEHIESTYAPICPLCDDVIMGCPTGSHYGVVIDTANHPTNSEPMHLRCVLDAGAEYGVIGLSVGPMLAPTGRHAARGVSLTKV